MFAVWQLFLICLGISFTLLGHMAVLSVVEIFNTSLQNFSLTIEAFKAANSVRQRNLFGVLAAFLLISCFILLGMFLLPLKGWCKYKTWCLILFALMWVLFSRALLREFSDLFPWMSVTLTAYQPLFKAEWYDFKNLLMFVVIWQFPLMLWDWLKKTQVYKDGLHLVKLKLHLQAYYPFQIPFKFKGGPIWGFLSGPFGFILAFTLSLYLGEVF